MNTVFRSWAAVQRRSSLGSTLPLASLPVYVKLPLLLSSVLAAALILWTILIHQTDSANPFAAYETVLPRQSSDEVIALKLSCNPNNRSDDSQYCTHAPANGPFSLVTATLSNGVVSRTHFTVHLDALALGDLALWWGRPHIRLYRQSAVFEWPSLGISAEGWAKSGRFSYAIPVWRISFGSPWTPHT